MIRYGFHFHSQERINIEAFTQEEDDKLHNLIYEGGMIVVPGKEKDFYINLDLVKVIIREEINENAQIEPMSEAPPIEVSPA